MSSRLMSIPHGAVHQCYDCFGGRLESSVSARTLGAHDHVTYAPTIFIRELHAMHLAFGSDTIKCGVGDCARTPAWLSPTSCGTDVTAAPTDSPTITEILGTPGCVRCYIFLKFVEQKHI